MNREQHLTEIKERRQMILSLAGIEKMIPLHADALKDALNEYEDSVLSMVEDANLSFISHEAATGQVSDAVYELRRSRDER